MQFSNLALSISFFQLAVFVWWKWSDKAFSNISYPKMSRRTRQTKNVPTLSESETEEEEVEKKSSPLKKALRSQVKVKASIPKIQKNTEAVCSSSDETTMKKVVAGNCEKSPVISTSPKQSRQGKSSSSSDSIQELDNKSKKNFSKKTKTKFLKKKARDIDSESPVKAKSNPTKTFSSSDSEPEKRIKIPVVGKRKAKVSEILPAKSKSDHVSSSELPLAISDSDAEPQKNESTDFNAIFEDLKSTLDVTENSPIPDSNIQAPSSECNSAPPTVSSSDADTTVLNDSTEQIEPSPHLKTTPENEKISPEVGQSDVATSIPENDESKENINENVNSESIEKPPITIAPLLRLVAIEKLLKPDVLLKQNEPEPSRQRKSAMNKNTRKVSRKKSIECIELSSSNSSSSDEDQIDISSTTSESKSSDSDEVVVKRRTSTRNTRQTQNTNGKSKSTISPNKIINKNEKIKSLSVNLQKMPKNVNSFVKVYKIDANSSNEKQSVKISSQNFNSDSDDFEKLISMTTIEKQTETAKEVEPVNETSNKSKKAPKKKAVPEKKKKSDPEPEKIQRATRATRHTCREPVERRYKEPTTTESEESEDEDSSQKNHKTSKNAKISTNKEKVVENREPIKPIKITKQMLESTNKDTASSSENEQASCKMSSQIEIGSTKSSSDTENLKAPEKSSSGKEFTKGALKINIKPGQEPDESNTDETEINVKNLITSPRNRNKVSEKFTMFRELQKKKSIDFTENKKSSNSPKTQENGSPRRSTRRELKSAIEVSDEEMEVDSQISPSASPTKTDKTELINSAVSILQEPAANLENTINEHKSVETLPVNFFTLNTHINNFLLNFKNFLVQN